MKTDDEDYSEDFLAYWEKCPLQWWERLFEEQKKTAYLFYLRGQNAAFEYVRTELTPVIKTKEANVRHTS